MHKRSLGFGLMVLMLRSVSALALDGTPSPANQFRYLPIRKMHFVKVWKITSLAHSKILWPL